MAIRTTCPECGSSDIYYDNGDERYDIGAEKGNSGSGNYILINKGLITRGAALDICVCGDCGYVRTFVAQQESLDAIKKTWNKLGDAE